MFLPDPSSPTAPATMSGTPSPSTSPTPETPEPNQSPFPRAGPRAVPEFISLAVLTVPSLFIKNTCTAPLLRPPLSSHGLPAAKSGTPSPSKSPTKDTDRPKRSFELSVTDLPSMTEDDFMVLSEFIKNTCTAPVFLPTKAGAPTAKSAVPSESRSAEDIESPKWLSRVSVGPFAVEPSILEWDFAVPSLLSSSRYTDPSSGYVRSS